MRTNTITPLQHKVCKKNAWTNQCSNMFKIPIANGVVKQHPTQAKVETSYQCQQHIKALKNPRR